MKNKLTWSASIFIPSFFFILLNTIFISINGVWWDDNTVWNVTHDALYKYLGPEDANEFFQYQYIKFVTETFSFESQIMVFHIISLFVHFISLVSSWYILKTITKDAYFTLFVMLLISVCGIDKTYMLIINSHATFANCFFIVGLAFFVKDYYSPNKLYKFIVSALWFISLCIWRTPALLIPLCVIVSSCSKNNLNYKSYNSCKKAFSYCLRNYWLIIFSCLLFLVLYKLYMSQSGGHADYYKPSVANIISAPILSVCSAISVFLYYLSSSVMSLASCTNLPFFLTYSIIVISSYIILKNVAIRIQYHSERLAVLSVLYLVSTLCLPLSIYGVFMLVGFEDYNSRTLCLASFPISVISVLMISRLPKEKFLGIYCLLFIGSLTYSVNNYLSYSFSTLKQEAIVDFLKSNEPLNGKNILVKDYAFSSNANNISLRNYEYEGMARLAYGVNTRTRIMSFYGGNQHIINPEYEIEIKQAEHPIGIPTKLMCYIKYIILNKREEKKLFIDDFFDISYNKY